MNVIPFLDKDLELKPSKERLDLNQKTESLNHWVRVFQRLLLKMNWIFFQRLFRELMKSMENKLLMKTRLTWRI